MTPDARRKFFNRCNPDEPLSPEDDRLVDIDQFNAGGTSARGYDWVEEIATNLDLSDQPITELFTGLRGSGKSTLLRRLTERLSPTADARGFLVVIIDAEQRFDLQDTIDAPDVLTMIAYEVEREVLGLEGRDPEDALRDGYLARFWSWLTRTDVELKQFELGANASLGAPTDLGAATVSVGPKVVVGLRNNPTLRKRLRETVDKNMATFLSEVRDCLAGLCERAVQRGRRGIVVVVDSLEKLRGTSSSFKAVLDSAEKLFGGGAPLLRLVRNRRDGQALPLIHALYTVPPALTMRNAMAGIHFMPMIKLADRVTQAPFAPGFKAAREIIRKRLPDAVLAELFGAPNVEARVEALVAWSGGYPREIVRLLQVMVKQPQTIDERLFLRLLQTAGDDYRRTVPGEAFAWLARVSLDHELVIDNEAQRELVDLMLSNNIVLRYQNDAEWFDLHPAVRDMDKLKTAREALAKARRDGTPVPPI